MLGVTKLIHVGHTWLSGGLIIKCKLHNSLVHTIRFSPKYICIKYHNHTTHFDTILSSSGLQASLLSRQCTNCVHEKVI